MATVSSSTLKEPLSMVMRGSLERTHSTSWDPSCVSSAASSSSRPGSRAKGTWGRGWGSGRPLRGSAGEALAMATASAAVSARSSGRLEVAKPSLPPQKTRMPNRVSQLVRIRLRSFFSKVTSVSRPELANTSAWSAPAAKAFCTPCSQRSSKFSGEITEPGMAERGKRTVLLST
jgi:hypothetical protein